MERTLLEFFELGGWAMWPLVAFSVATLSLILERTIVLMMQNLKVSRLRSSVVDALSDGDYAGAGESCKGAPRRTVAAPVFLAALEAAPLGEHRMERAMEAASSERMHALERGLDLLVALGSIAPITGFLGTVSGMIAAFNSIAQAADVNAQLVAGGIFEALITTAYGLAIAIVAITGYNIFAHIVDRFAADLEEAGNDVITALIRSGITGSPSTGAPEEEEVAREATPVEGGR